MSQLTPHTHAAIIKAWADGAQIEYRGASDPDGEWRSCRRPTWRATTQYRVKPREPQTFFVNVTTTGPCYAYRDRATADHAARFDHDRTECITVREVVE